MPNTGPNEGSLKARIAFLLSLLKASASPIVVVVLPSPTGVGLIAVTKLIYHFVYWNWIVEINQLLPYIFHKVQYIFHNFAFLCNFQDIF